MGTITLKKDQIETITAEELSAGVGWKTSKTKVKRIAGFKVGGGKQKELDLDLMAVAEDTDGDPTAVCYYGNDDVWDDGSLISEGDNQTGVGVGDDETIRAKLTKLPAHVRKLTFLVTAFKEGASFSDVETAELNIYNDKTGEKLISISVKLNARGNAVAVASATKQDDGTWVIKALNTYEQINGSRDSILAFSGRVSRAGG